MKTKIAASLIAITAMAAAAPALAQAPAAAPAKTDATASAAAGLSVDKTPINEIVKNDKAKAALEAAVPGIAQYYDQIGSMTLKQVQPMSQGALTDDMVSKVQVEFDKINAGK